MSLILKDTLSSLLMRVSSQTKNFLMSYTQFNHQNIVSRQLKEQRLKIISIVKDHEIPMQMFCQQVNQLQH